MCACVSQRATRACVLIPMGLPALRMMYTKGILEVRQESLIVSAACFASSGSSADGLLYCFLRRLHGDRRRRWEPPMARRRSERLGQLCMPLAMTWSMFCRSAVPEFSSSCLST